MSALPPIATEKADVCTATTDVGYGPIADISAVVPKDFVAPVTPARFRLSRQTLWENPSALEVRLA